MFKFSKTHTAFVTSVLTVIIASFLMPAQAQQTNIPTKTPATAAAPASLRRYTGQGVCIYLRYKGSVQMNGDEGLVGTMLINTPSIGLRGMFTCKLLQEGDHLAGTIAENQLGIFNGRNIKGSFKARYDGDDLVVYSIDTANNKDDVFVLKNEKLLDYSQKYFDTTLQRVPTNYRGNPVRDVFASLRELAKQDEFESDVEYKTRVLNALKITGDDKKRYLSFVAELPASCFSYNANTKTVSLSDYKDFFSYSYISPENCVPDDLVQGYVEWGLSNLPMMPSSLKIVNTPPDIARRIKKSVNLLILYKVATSKGAFSTTYQEPRTERGERHDYVRLYTDIKEIWVYDGLSGDIYDQLIVQPK